MPHLNPSLARRLYPLRYWIFVAYAVGLPNFVKFDNTGLTHKEGLFNLSSISTILLTLTTGFFFAVMTLLNRQRLLLRKIDVSAGLWILLLADLLIASILQPKSHTVPFKVSDLPLSIYRLGEWVLAFFLLLSLYTRETVEGATDLIIRIIALVCWVNIAFVWIALPIVPSMVYAMPGDTIQGYPRLGGTMLHPVHLSVLAGVGFFHAIIFMRGPKRMAACALAFVTLVLTYARSELIVFLVMLVIYALVLSRSVLLRYSGLLTGAGIIGLAVVFYEFVLKYLERGQGVRNIATLSERTMVWHASFLAIESRPFIGYGFIAGGKNALRDHWNSTNWVPPHAHSEFIQALLSGGIPAAVLVVAIYGTVLWYGIRGARQGIKQVFLLLVVIQITLMAIIMPVITLQFKSTSGLFLLAFVGVVARLRNPTAQTVARGVALERPTVFGWAKQL
jgi:O-antigen ligase